MILAEAPSFTAEEVFFALLVLVVLALASLAVLVLGFVWAGRAGRGSQAALVGWTMVLAIEGLAVVSVLATDPGGGVAWPLGLMAAQTAVFLRARRRRGGQA